MAMDIMAGFGGSQIGQIFTTVGTILLYVLAGALVFGVFFVFGYFFFRPMMYRIHVNVFARRHGKYIQLGTDKAKIKKIRTKFFGLMGAVKQIKIQLLKRKINLPTPDFDKLYPNDLRNSPGTVNYLKFGEMDYALCDIELKDDKVNLIPIETDMKGWHLQEIQDSRERNSPTDFFQRNQVVIIAGIGLLVVGIIMYGGFKWYQTIFDNLGTTLSHLDKTLEALNGCRV